MALFHLCSCDFILPPVTPSLYDISSCKAFLHHSLLDMYKLGREVGAGTTAAHAACWKM